MADITIYKKADQTITFQYYETDGVTPRALTSATVFFTVKANPYDSDADDSEATITATVTNHTNPSGGLTTITLSDTATDVDPKKYFYDIKVKEQDGNIYRAQSGRCTVLPTTTNRTS